MEIKDFTKNILSDIRVDLTEEFDRNFERKGFFTNKWRGTNLPNRRGSLMVRSGNLRRSIRSKQSSNDINWSSSLPYASINNDGGEIEVTEKMKRFFWAMYYKASGASKGKGERAQRLSAEAQQWKNLALQKVGAKMKIEQRQFIGDHPIVRQRVEDIVDLNVQEFKDYIFNQMKK
ncbi:hypothetical protein [Flavobacterium sp. N2820]|uniref:hypothetical protein n=1 Tax=Flavobacterium sp. N2820 TaxID=2986834 RepID=UPI0022242860|nr:hypothetical protein [Flavobacterium sp. N2820]